MASCQLKGLKLAVAFLLAQVALLYVSRSKVDLVPLVYRCREERVELSGKKDQSSSVVVSKSMIIDESIINNNDNRLPIENITWIGRQYFFPPGYKIYHPRELEEIWKETTLWVGDSTMRRAMLTFRFMLRDTFNTQSILAIDDVKYLNVNKKDVEPKRKSWEDEPCDRYDNETIFPIPHEGVVCWDAEHTNMTNDFFGEACLAPFLDFLHQHPNVLQNYKVLVLSLGLYDVMGRCEGSSFREEGVTRQQRLERRQLRAYDLAQQVLNRLSEFPQLTVVWRTMGFHTKFQQHPDHAIANRQVVDLIRSNYSKTNIQLVDWATAVFDRSFEDNRLVGDNHYHYGHEARLLFLQMLANVLDDSSPASS